MVPYEVNRLLISMSGVVALSAGVVLGSSNVYQSGFACRMTGFSSSGMPTPATGSGWESCFGPAKFSGFPDWHEKLLRQVSRRDRKSLNEAILMRGWRDVGLRFIDYNWSDEAHPLSHGFVKRSGPDGIAVSYDDEIRRHPVFAPDIHTRCWNDDWFDLTTFAGNYGTDADSSERLSVSLRQLNNNTTPNEAHTSTKVFEHGAIHEVADISVLPEPDSLGLLLLGTIAVIGCRWRSKMGRTAKQPASGTSSSSGPDRYSICNRS